MALIPLHLDVDPATGDDRPVWVLLHGFTQTGRSWGPVRDALRRAVPRGARTVTVDLIGHGASPAPADVSSYGMAACLEQLAGSLAGLGMKRAWWVGYSMGGRVALNLAVHKPEWVQGLVLISTTAGLEDAKARAGRVRADETLATRIETGGVEPFVEDWLRLPLFEGLRALPPRSFAALRAERLVHSATGLANSLRGMGTGAMAPLWDQLPGVTVPVLVLAGERDPKFVTIAHRLAQAMPQATLRIVPEAGHSLHLEKPEAFVQTVRAFLGEREDRAL